MAERFFGSLKRERTSKRSYLTRQEAREDVIDSLEVFYNSWRKHSYLGYVSPNEYEKIARVAKFCVRFHLTTTFSHATRRCAVKHVLRRHYTATSRIACDWGCYTASGRKRPCIMMLYGYAPPSPP